MLGCLSDGRRAAGRGRSFSAWTFAGILLGGLGLLGCSGYDGEPDPDGGLDGPAGPTGPAAPPPTELTITSVFPSSGPQAGGTPLLVEGGLFDRGETSVLVGGQPATSVLVLDETRLSCLVPPQAPGAIDVAATVEVRNEAGTTTAESLFRYQAQAGTQDGAGPSIELQGNPSLSFDTQIGTTTVAFDFIVRDSSGVPLQKDGDYTVRMFVDDEELGVSDAFNESVLNEEATELELNLLQLYVLDASFSLTQFVPDQFDPMLVAARDSIATGFDIWGTAVEEKKRGRFFWDVAWFRDLVESAGVEIVPDQILNIRRPVEGDFTKLYAGVSWMLARSASEFQAGGGGVATGARDRHVIVVFTDGGDNLSFFDNPGVTLGDTLTDGTPVERRGWSATGLDDLFDEIQRHPAYPTNLTVHTAGLGTGVEEEKLRQLAQIGFGRFFSSLDSVSQVFGDITQEFTSLQSLGAEMALAPAAYDFRLLVETSDGQEAEVRFRFRVRADNTVVLL